MEQGGEGQRLWLMSLFSSFGKHQDENWGQKDCQREEVSGAFHDHHQGKAKGQGSVLKYALYSQTYRWFHQMDSNSKHTCNSLLGDYVAIWTLSVLERFIKQAQKHNFHILGSCGSVVEHCISSAKSCGFNSQGTKKYSLNALSRFG